jgi:hypothetical protein
LHKGPARGPFFGRAIAAVRSNKRKLIVAIFIRLTKIFVRSFFGSPLLEMRKKNLLHYELYGTSARGDKKGYWRWAIFAGREEKPLDAGSFYGTLEEAKGHAEDTISSLKQRARKHTTPRSK